MQKDISRGACDLTSIGLPLRSWSERFLPCEQRAIRIEPDDISFQDRATGRHHFRIGFATIPLRAIESGIQQLGEVAGEAV